MTASHPWAPLPAEPLLGTFALCFRTNLVADTPRTLAIRAARQTWLTDDFLDTADDARLGHEVTTFYTGIQPVPLHAGTVVRRVRLVRFALVHLLRGHDPLAVRLGRCVATGANYAVPGLGPTFWAAVAKALDPDHIPLWCPAVERGVARLAVFAAMTPADTVADRFAALETAYARLRLLAPDLPATALDDFLERVGRTAGRDLPADVNPDPAAWAWQPGPAAVAHAVRQVRTGTPLRKRLRQAGPGGRTDTDFRPLDDGWDRSLDEIDRQRLAADVVGVLRDRFRVHPLEVPDVLRVLAGGGADVERKSSVGGRVFHGFATDTFRFLADLEANNNRDWMRSQAGRYAFVLREPLAELCGALAERYVRPVLNREHGWDLECGAKPGRALTSICKNDFGRSGPYQPVQWVTFYRKAQANKRADAQFFLRVAADGVGYGFHLGRSARDAGRRFRANVQAHADALHHALAAGQVFEEYRFWADEACSQPVAVRTAADLRAWAAGKTLVAGRRRPPADALLRRDELVGEVLLAFDRLLPLYACAADDDPRPVLHRRAGGADGKPPFDRDAFRRETFLSDVWIDRVRGLLALKKQLILQGVPGTGKTHVAQSLARLLTGGRPECVRLVQFHPSYSYEEFVEGIKVRAAEVNGKSEVTYPVEDGVLAEFAARAAARPSEPHVLVIDEINRGNLPRVFGELLYLLEYREKEVTLPYSKRAFRLPDNLLVLATMNAADRSAAALDHALRRRFSFVDMPPDAALLAGWLDAHPPADADEAFGPRLVRAFEELNRRLSRDLGPDKQVGHSFFMVPGLDAAKLAAVWEHHVRPLLLDYLGGRAERLGAYSLDKLLTGEGRRPARSSVVNEDHGP